MNKRLKQAVTKEYEQKFVKKKFRPGQDWVRVSGKVFNEQEMIKMVEAVMDGWWTEGRFSKELEQKLAEYVGVKFCSLVNSGSSANLLALMSLKSHLLGERRLRQGDEVITVAAGFPTTVNPIIQAGLVPVMVDIELKTLQIQVKDLEKARSKKTRAVMIAHTLGNPFNVKAIKRFCKRYNLWLVEDNCDALGSEYEGKRTGSFGDVATQSFYPAHHITTGEGGAVLTDNALINKIVRSLRDWGRDCWCATGCDNTCQKRFSWKWPKLPDGYDHKYVYSHLGYNLKLTDMQAALGLAQMRKLKSFTKKRRENYVAIKKMLKQFEDKLMVMEATKGSNPSWFGVGVVLKGEASGRREELMRFLNDKKVATRLVFGGNLTKQPYFDNAEVKYRQVGALKNTDKVMKDAFWLGCFPEITTKMIKYVEKCLVEFFKEREAVLVTGATGFIGSHLVKRLVSEGYKVVGIKRTASKMDRLGEVADKIKWYGAGQAGLDKAFGENKVKAVMHLATKYVKSGETSKEVEEMIETNLKLGVRLVEKCLEYKVDQFINTGSFFEFELGKGKIKEGDKKEAYNLYAGMKLGFSQALRYFAGRKKIKVVDMKLFAPFGEQDNFKLVQFLVKNLKEGKVVEFSGGEQRWNFTYVGDIVEALMVGLGRMDEVGGYEEVCVGYGRAVSIRMLVRKLEKIAGKRLKIKWGAKSYTDKEIMQVSCDNAKLKSWGWKVRYGLDRGLKRTYNGYFSILLLIFFVTY